MGTCCKCGFNRFIAHQLVRMDVIVDENNYFEESVEGGIYDCETPYGPYTCTNCGAEYDSLKELNSL